MSSPRSNRWARGLPAVPLSGEKAGERAGMDAVDRRRSEANPVAEKTEMSVLFLTKDLVFSSRVSGRTQALGIELSVVSQADQLVANAARHQVQLVLLDLNTPGLDLNQLVPQLRRPTRPPKAIIAFGPHVHEARLAAAREAGCDEVLARGEFNSHMAGILAKYVGSGDQTGDEAEASDSAGQV